MGGVLNVTINLERKKVKPWRDIHINGTTGPSSSDLEVLNHIFPPFQ